jgi:polysaccharide biosynthesis transport protein
MKTIDEFSDQEPAPQSGGIGLNDIIRMLFKHKWKLALFTLLGLGAAAAIYINHTPEYESTSKIFVRYVEEVSNVDSTPGGAMRSMPNSEGVITAETEILKSWDLAKEVVEEVTPAFILGPRAEASLSLATHRFVSGLDVDAPKGSRVITVSFRHIDPDVAVKALNTLVKLYREKHVEIHRATKSRETSRSRRTAMTAKLTELTEEIEKVKAENGISSLPDAAAGLNKRSDDIRTDASHAEVELAEQKARILDLEAKGYLKEAAALSGQEKSSGEVAPQADPKPDHAVHLKYQALVKQLTRLQDEELALLSSYSPEGEPVKAKRREIKDAEAQRAKLEAEHPALLRVTPVTSSGASVPQSIDPMMETVRLATLTARVDLLRKREETLKEEFKQFSGISKRIHELERERDLQTEGLKHFAANFQRTEFETPLTADQYDNIVVVQSSSPPVLALSKLMKVVAAVGFGGLALGLAVVAFLELVLNRSIKRPLELEVRSGIPLFLNIPNVSRKNRRALANGRKRPAGQELIASGPEPWAGGHFIRPYAEAIRDRLVLHFEQIGLTRKPKLVAVASYSKGAGVSTIASGIASALSEVGDGKVLLVDMNVAHAAVHPFFEGKPAATLTDALESGGKIESVSENLYLATAANGNGNSGAQMFPKRFYDLMPNFQASDFDYIIFDMPPMDESTLTLAMSGYMDKTLLVVEAEKDNRDVVKRASAELLRARARLSGILNKTRSYGPKWLQEA